MFFSIPFVQGGVYLFQLVDHYGANGASILFVSLVQCVAVGWAFGEWYQSFKMGAEAYRKIQSGGPDTFTHFLYSYTI